VLKIICRKSKVNPEVKENIAVNGIVPQERDLSRPYFCQGMAV
jgi:hypothetical protein